MTPDRSFEDRLGLRFAPTYVSSAGEDRYLAELEPMPSPRIALGHPPWKPCIYFSVFRYPPRGDENTFEINYLSIWDRDTGGLMGIFGPHQWDTERTAVLVQGPAGDRDPSSFLIAEAYYAAHEGTSINTSSYQRPPKEDRGVTVYWSLGKHASYPTQPPLFMALVDRINPPEVRVEPSAYILKNAGNLANPTDLAPWINYQEDWGPDRVSSIHEKLKDPIWSPKPKSSGWIRNLPGTILAGDEVMHLQESFGLQPNGILDPSLYAELSALSPELVRNAKLMNRDLLAEVARLRPKKTNPALIASFLKGDGSLRPVMAPKRIEGRVAGATGVKAVNLGQLPDTEMALYGLIRPGEKEIFEVRAAPILTITKSKLSPSDLRELPLGHEP